MSETFNELNLTEETEENNPVHLIALDQVDGIVVFEEGGVTYRMKMSHAPEEIENLDGLDQERFELMDKDFDCWDEFSAYLHLNVMYDRWSSGYHLISRAPEYTLSRWLDKVEQVLLPNGSFNQAENILNQVFIADHLGELKDRTWDLLRKVRKDVRKLSEVKRPPPPYEPEAEAVKATRATNAMMDKVKR